MNKGKLFILSGQSGVGKNTILEAIIQKYPAFHRAVTCTTREPRPGEINGRDHYFISNEKFDRMIKNGEFLEYAKVHHWLYGTPLKQINDALNAGGNVLMEIDVQGVRQIKEKVPDFVSIFIQYEPGKVEELIRKRISNDPQRKNMSEEEIKKRIESAQKEAGYIKYYDYNIINPEGHPEKAIKAVEEIISRNS